MCDMASLVTSAERTQLVKLLFRLCCRKLRQDYGFEGDQAEHDSDDEKQNLYSVKAVLKNVIDNITNQDLYSLSSGARPVPAGPAAPAKPRPSSSAGRRKRKDDNESKCKKQRNS